MIVPMIKSPMMPGLEGVLPAPGAFAVGGGRDLRAVAEGAASTEMRVRDGDTVTLAQSIVRRTIAGHTLAMYAFNGQAPGPLLPRPPGCHVLRALSRTGSISPRRFTGTASDWRTRPTAHPA